MTDPSPHPDAGDYQHGQPDAVNPDVGTPDAGEDTTAGASREEPPRMPRWVKVAAVIAGILVLIFVVLKLTGVGGEHGPGRHAPEGAALPATVAVGPTPPETGLG